MGFSSPPDPKLFNLQIWEIVKQVPAGKVTTYGFVASMIPPPGTMNAKDYLAFAPRWAGGAMAQCPGDVPWQRVINAQGKISQRKGSERQRILLEAEGVIFDERGKIDLDVFGWAGPSAEWLKENGFVAPLKKSKVESQKPLF